MSKRKRFSYKKTFPSVDEFVRVVIERKNSGYIDYVVGITDAVYKTPSVFSATTWMVKYRRGIKKSSLLSDEEKGLIMYYSKIPAPVLAIRKKLEADALIKRQRNNLVVEDPEAMIDIAIKLLASDQWSRRAIAIGLLTGRRFIEIVKVGVFLPSSKGAHHILFGGQAKSKFSRAYDFPLCTDKVDAKAVIGSINRIRNEWTKPKNLDVKDNYQASYAGSSTVRQSTRKWFPQLTTFKDLRGLYGAVCYHKFGLKSATSETRYLSDILGHHPTDLRSGTSYAVYKIK